MSERHRVAEQEQPVDEKTGLTPRPTGDAGRERQLAFFRNPEVPDYIQRLVEGYIERKTTKAWDDPVVLDRMRNAILVQKSRYSVLR